MRASLVSSSSSIKHEALTLLHVIKSEHRNLRDAILTGGNPARIWPRLLRKL